MTPRLSSPMASDQLVELLESLPPWSDRDFSEDQWQSYVQVAAAFAQVTPPVVEAALSEFLRRALNKKYEGFEEESKPFILMRVLFELPESVLVGERQSFKGWTNWPEPDHQGRVSVCWPVSWLQGRPQLVAPYAGSLGLPYDAVAEYRWFGDRYPLRHALGVSKS